MTPPPVGHMVRIALNVRNLNRSIAFYIDALGFQLRARTAGRACLTIGSENIELISRAAADAYPEPRAANDPWFQHFAIAVADMDVAYARLSRCSPEPITRGGPQLLPPSTGSVTAYKFRDPDGHPLELSYAPASGWSRLRPPANTVFLGIDHTALAVRSLMRSIAFYTGLGFRIGTRSVNQGPEQARLDGLDGAVVDIVTLLTLEPGPHIELLHYRSPEPPVAREIGESEIAATQTVLAGLGTAEAEDRADASARCSRDPDGHLLCLIT